MDPLVQPVLQAFPDVVAGTELTVVLSLIAIVLSMALAVPAGFGRLSRNTVVRSVSSFYVETIRGTPLLLQLFVWAYAVPILLLTLFNFNPDVTAYNILTALNSNRLFPQQGISIVFFAVVGLSVNYGAYLAEVVRAGVQAVDAGQTEASLSLGMSRSQTARLVVLPQALRLMVPPLTNNFITLVQDTSFLSILGVPELALVIQGHTEGTGNPYTRWGFYITELAIYFVICYGLSLISRRYQGDLGAVARPRRFALVPLVGRAHE
jgi:His/Glu/Gln/Arg/opine family amino acid ABC transporter permease subunit